MSLLVPRLPVTREELSEVLANGRLLGTLGLGYAEHGTRGLGKIDTQASSLRVERVCMPRKDDEEVCLLLGQEVIYVEFMRGHGRARLVEVQQAEPLLWHGF